MLRKERIIQHGSSNKPTLPNHHLSTFNPNSTHSHFLKPHLQKSMSLKQISQLNKNHHRLSQIHHEPLQHRVVTQLEEKIKSKYLGKKDIIKTLKSWGFQDKAYITSEEFHKKLQQLMKSDIPSKEVDQLAKKYCRMDNSQWNVKAFIELIHAPTDGISVDENLFNPSQTNPQLQTRIKYLQDEVHPQMQLFNEKNITFEEMNLLLRKVNSSIAKIKRNQPQLIEANEVFQRIYSHGKFSIKQKWILSHVQPLIDQQMLAVNINEHKNTDHIFSDPIFRKTDLLRSKEEETVIEGANLPEKYDTSASSFKRSSSNYAFSPKMFFNQNQQKTRFGATPFATTTLWNQTASNQLQQSIFQREKIGYAKQKVDHDLKELKQIEKMRYENKLEQMRENQRKQKENIEKIQREASRRDEGNRRKLYNECAAYNYMNFIKKKWE